MSGFKYLRQGFVKDQFLHKLLDFSLYDIDDEFWDVLINRHEIYEQVFCEKYIE